jgi:glycosyltransferase involved in cell wall biosynthesis
MSGIGLRAVDVVQRRHKAKVFLERSSRHILSQREILEAIPGSKDPVPDVNRELAGYALADVITVPSRHVEESFLERGFPASKLFLNPFGVSLDAFRPTPAPPASATKTVVMVGAWSMQKGCDVLVEAWRGLSGVRLLHIGPILDAPVPSDSMFEHVDSVPQAELPEYYAQAHVLALASRQDGFGVVLAQALACGVKVVCTSRTGGEDLKVWTTRDDAVMLVPPDDPLRLRSALAAALERQPNPGALRDLLGDNRAELSWRASAIRYAKRMQQELG